MPEGVEFHLSPGSGTTKQTDNALFIPGLRTRSLLCFLRFVGEFDLDLTAYRTDGSSLGYGEAAHESFVDGFAQSRVDWHMRRCFASSNRRYLDLDRSRQLCDHAHVCTAHLWLLTTFHQRVLTPSRVHLSPVGRL